MLLRLNKTASSKLYKSFNEWEQNLLEMASYGDPIDPKSSEMLNDKIQTLDENTGGYISWKWRMNKNSYEQTK